MNQPPNSRSPWLGTACKVALVYVVAAGLWVTFSDQLIARVAADAEELSRWQTAKGWLFVAATGALLFTYLVRCLRRQHDAFHALTTLFDSLPAIVYVADMQTHDLLYVNTYANERFGVQWRQKKCFDYLQQGQQQPCAFCSNPLLVSNGQPGEAVTWEFRNTINGRWYQCLDKAMRWPDGRLVRMEVALDITERKEMERTKEELLAAVSHDMRTPLTAITGFAEVLADDQTLPAQGRRHAETILREAEKLHELIQLFLEVRRLKSDQARIDYEILPLRRLFEDVVGKSAECSSRHTVAIDCDESLVIFGNRRELSQVFKQLLNNACRFSPAGGPIRLEAYDTGRNVEISIVDQGIGIAAEEQERIFEPFHRLDIGDRRRVRGIGLGLAMVREIVTLHGGAIQVESTPGQGSRFTITLPLPPSAPAERIAQANR